NQSQFVWWNVALRVGRQVFLVPIESGNDRADGGITGNDTVEIGRILFSFNQPLATTIRAAREIRAGAPAIEPLRNGLPRDCREVHTSKQEIVLFGLVVERPAPIEKATLMPSVSKGGRKACL